MLRLILVLEQEHRLAAEPAQRATSAFEGKAELLCSNPDLLLLALLTSGPGPESSGVGGRLDVPVRRLNRRE